MWSGHTHRLQDGSECIRALGQFGETMRLTSAKLEPSSNGLKKSLATRRNHLSPADKRWQQHSPTWSAFFLTRLSTREPVLPGTDQFGLEDA